jgi:hypothetical protein
MAFSAMCRATSRNPRRLNAAAAVTPVVDGKRIVF